jgi:transcriptional regulator with XRE-family HTH domain
MLIYEAFDQTLKTYRIGGRVLADKAQVSESMISQFRRGKKGVTDDTLDKMLEAMQEIEPDSRSYFCQLIAGYPLEKNQVINSIDDIPEDEIPKVLIAIAQRWKSLDRSIEARVLVSTSA